MPKLTHLYHGTVNVWLPSILREGLHYQASNQWQVALEDGYKPASEDDPGYVYLAPTKAHARDYANLKARYLKTARCGEVLSSRLAGMTKDCNAPVISDAKPVILAIDVKSLDTALLGEDIADLSAYKYKGSIGPEHITVIK